MSRIDEETHLDESGCSGDCLDESGCLSRLSGHVISRVLWMNIEVLAVPETVWMSLAVSRDCLDM